jgi:hypothetical protein
MPAAGSVIAVLVLVKQAATIAANARGRAAERGRVETAAGTAVAAERAWRASAAAAMKDSEPPAATAAFPTARAAKIAVRGPSTAAKPAALAAAGTTVEFTQAAMEQAAELLQVVLACVVPVGDGWCVVGTAGIQVNGRDKPRNRVKILGAGRSARWRRQADS